MLVHNDIKNNNGNCLMQDKTNLLNIATQGGSSCSTTSISIDDITIFKKMGITYDCALYDHDYDIPALPNISLLSKNVVVYIAGYVVKMTRRYIKCPVCVEALENVASGACDDSFMFLNRKNVGGLIKPSQNVIVICQRIEQQIRKLLVITDAKVPKEKAFFDSFVRLLTNAVYQNSFIDLKEHMLNTALVDGNFSNHILDMLKVIVTSYCKIRFNSLTKKQTEKAVGNLIRKTLSRLIIFSHQ
ncbi:hypothetical protein RN001_005347 [Aquatica leii]|uniref:Uncharacterized protein n=1 Tax=Aquatica leii TaxID=1421715 RepID=A0AAN7SPU2_9COLE|nr:hypothetical protein RN001_005347 [Aquatica leii]